MPPHQPPRDYPRHQAPGRQQPAPVSKPAKNKKTMMIIIILAVLLGLAILAVVLLSAKNSS